MPKSLKSKPKAQLQIQAQTGSLQAGLLALEKDDDDWTI